MTSLTSPYGAVDSDDKTRVQCNLPTEMYQELFIHMFPMRGAQDRITAHLLVWFHRQLKQNSVPVHFELQNEQRAQDLLNQLNTCNLTINLNDPHVPTI